MAKAASGVGAAVSTVGDKVKEPVAKAKGPALAVAATAAGLVGGAVLGARASAKPKKVLGVPIPGTGNSLTKQVGKAGKQAGKAGKQFAELAQEVREARRKAEDIGKAIT